MIEKNLKQKITFLLLYLILFTGCAHQNNSNSNSKKEQFEWTTENLILSQLDPTLLKKLNLGGRDGEAEVTSSKDPQNKSSFTNQTIPTRCRPVDSILSGSNDLKDKFVLSQYSENGSPDNWFYMWVRTFESELEAKNQMKSIFEVVDSCGTFTKIKENSDSSQWNIFNNIAKKEESSIIVSNKTSALTFGQVGSAIYVQWLLFDGRYPLTSNLIESSAETTASQIETNLKSIQTKT